MSICSALLDLRAVEHTELIWQTWDDELLDPMHWHRSDIEQILAADPQDATREAERKGAELERKGLQDWISWWYCFDPRRYERASKRPETKRTWSGRRDAGAAVDVERQRKAKARKKTKQARAARRRQRRRKKR